MAEEEPSGLAARVFAYGSNMCSGRLRDYEVHPLRRGTAAVLRHHRLCFNKRSTKDASGKANVEPQVETDVWGVLYEIPEHELPILARREKGYTPRCMPIEITGNLNADAWVFVAIEPDPNPALRPYSWYKRFLVDGATEHQLREEYIEGLRAIAADEDPCAERDRSQRELRCSEEP